MDWSGIAFDAQSPRIVPKGFTGVDNHWYIKIPSGLNNAKAVDELAEAIAKAANKAKQNGQTSAEVQNTVAALIDKSARVNQHKEGALYKKWTDTLLAAVKKKWIAD
jgi:hypothetical protein